MMLLGALFLGILLAGMAEAAYRGIETQWPESYASAIRVIERAPRSGPIGYILFRAVPIFVIALAGLVSAERLGLPARTVAGVLLFAYLCMRDGRALLEIIRGADPRKTVLALLHLFNLAIIGVAICVAYRLRFALSSFVPPPEELLAAAWTAGFVAVLAVLVRLFFARPSRSGDDVKSLQSGVSDRLWSYTVEMAQRNNCAPELARAIVMCEAAQRPGWFRAGERLVGHLLRKQRLTYGIAQVGADHPLSDEESIRVLCQGIRDCYPGRFDSLGQYQSFRRVLMLHNQSKWFLSTAEDLYRELVGMYCGATKTRAYDARPRCEVLDISSSKTGDIVRGTVVRTDTDAPFSVRDATTGQVICDISTEPSLFRVEFNCPAASCLESVVLYSGEERDGDAFSLAEKAHHAWTR